MVYKIFIINISAVKAYIYVANETPANIYFDDFSIKHTKAIKVIQENHYYPFGMSMKGLELKGNPDYRFKFNGIERVENFELNWDMALFRSYDQILGLWGQSDPKYNYSQSVYSGFGNNPLRYIDLLGDTISIHYGDNQTLQYNQGLKYNGDNAFVNTLVNTLNDIVQTKGGGNILDALINSEQNYSYINQYSKDANGKDMKGAFKYERHGSREGGTIYAGAISEFENKGGREIASIAHESFHAYQDENNSFSSGHHIGLEVEANLFGASTYFYSLVNNGEIPDIAEWKVLSYLGSKDNDQGRIYSIQISNLLEDYSSKNFKAASENFIQGASKGHFYKRTPVRIYQSPLIKKFYPLLKN